MAMTSKAIKLYKIMKEKFSEEEAADIVDCMQPIISEERLNSFATRDDISRLEKRMEGFATKKDFESLEKRKEDFATHENLLKMQLEIQADVHKWIVGTGIALASLIVGAGGLFYSTL